MCLKAVVQINKPLLWKEESLSLRMKPSGDQQFQLVPFILLIPRNVILQVPEKDL